MSYEHLTGGAHALTGWLRTLRIIVFALVMGVATYAGFVISQNLGKPHTLGTGLNSTGIVMLVGGLVALVLGFVVPSFVLATGNVPTNPPPGLTPEQMKMVTPELVRLDSILQRLQSSTIIAGALFEGGAFANLFSYSQTRELLHLILGCVLILAIASLFPTSARAQQRVDEMLRRAKDEDSFARS